MSTIIDGAVTGDVPSDVGVRRPAVPSSSDADAPEPTPRRLALRWVGDLSALIPLVVLLPGLTNRDGGRGFAATLVLAVATAPALPVAWSEVRRLPRVAVGLLATWTGALALGVVAARYRADMVVPLLQYTIAPVLLLAARRVWRRPWGPAALVALFGIALARYQVRSWLDWWAQTEGGTGYWRPLSWRNPSAALTGMIGVWFLGVGLMSARLVRVGMGLLAATALAGTWLSSSRAGLAVTVGAVLVVVVVTARAARVHGRPVFAPLAASAGVVLATAGVVAALLTMQPSGTGQALAGRDQSVEQNTLARIEHSEAAFGMFLDRPMTGQGLGSYKSLARQWNDPNGNLTSSAHNEYAEVAGETGILGLVALLGALGGLSWLGVTQLRRPPRPGSLHDLRPGLAVGATGAAALFLVHSAVDFDWNYPVLSGMAAVAAAILLPERARMEAAPWLARGTATALGLLLVGGLGMAAVERSDTPAPWRDAPHVSTAEEALQAGRSDDALRAAAAALRWNPGSPAARSLHALAQYELNDDAEALEHALEEQPTWFVGRARAAMALARADESARASAIIAELHADLDDHRAWGVQSSRLMAVEAEVVLAATRSCEAAEAVVDRWTRADVNAERGLPGFADEILSARLGREGCVAG